MKSVFNTVVFLISNLSFEIQTYPYGNRSHSCGVDLSPVSVVYEGVAAIETYPWMGILYYPANDLRYTTVVVLVTRQMAIATASEIDKLPKSSFRTKARVVLGHKCGKNELRVRTYTYHPEYDKHTSNALALIQLETDHVKTELRPICQPPAHFQEPQFYAFTLVNSCKNPKLTIRKMEYVNDVECKDFYRRNELDQGSMWPVHAACARAVSGGRCVWRSGSVLAVKQEGRWRLLGFSVYGPGCGAPSRFLHYGIYHEWVRRSTSTIGQPAVTRLADDHIIMRRSLSNVQRYGPCDPGETVWKIYSDKIAIGYRPEYFTARYNMTLYANVEYSCIIFKMRPLNEDNYRALRLLPKLPWKETKPKHTKPKINVRGWCNANSGFCFDFQFHEIRFYVEIVFGQGSEFSVDMYGKEASIISAPLALKDANYRNGSHPVLMSLEELRNTAKKRKWYQYNSGWSAAEQPNVNITKKPKLKFR